MPRRLNKREQQKIKSTRAMLDAALHVFGEYGYYATAFADISQLANVTNGLIVQRFGSKKELFLELFNEILIKNFPKLNNTKTIYENLTSIIHFIKFQGETSADRVLFGRMSLNALASLPDECYKTFMNLYTECGAKDVFEKWVNERDISNTKPVDVFGGFLGDCFDLANNLLSSNNPLSQDELFIRLFDKWEALDKSKVESSAFTEIANKTAEYCEVVTWYAEFSNNHKPYLYFPKKILKMIGLKENEKPDIVYRYWVKHINSNDRLVVDNAIQRLLSGERIEFVFGWSSKMMPNVKLRCIGINLIENKDSIRLEGIFQNIESFTHLQNNREMRQFLMNAVAKDYEFVNYIYLGASSSDDYAEDYKTSDFINKLTNSWENKENFAERMEIFANKVVCTYDREEFLKKSKRSVIIDNLRIANTYKVTFRIQCYGAFYPYEFVFYADRDNGGSLCGIIACIRMVSGGDEYNKVRKNLYDAKQDSDRIKAFSKLLLDDYEAAYLVNLYNHSFEIYKRSNNVANRNMVNPDFDVYIQSYINRDVYFEDRGSMVEACCVDNIRTRLFRSSVYAINFRDISTGQPLYYKMRVIRAGKQYAAVVFTYIHDEMMKEINDRERMEYLIREQTEQLTEKNRVLEGVNTGFIDLIGDIVNLRNDSTLHIKSNIKELTYILGCQFVNDNPDIDLDNRKILEISEASILRDVGKIAIPDSILFKAGKLTDEEFSVMKTHTEKSMRIIEKFRKFWSKEYYDLVCDICKYHHERWDGNGYPNGLVGNEIPLSAQIVGLTDVFNALTSERIYKGPYSPEKAYEMIVSGECGLFNPRLIDSLTACLGRLKQCLENKKDTELMDQKIGSISSSYKNVAFINENTLPVITAMSEHMPGGFFICKADNQGTLLFFNTLLTKYFKCESKEDFIQYVNNSSRGIVHPDEYDSLMASINRQVQEHKENLNEIKFRIVCKDGEERMMMSYGRLVQSDTYGDIYYVFVLDITDSEKAEKRRLSSTIRQDNKQKVEDQTTMQSRGIRSLEDVRILIVDDNDLSRLMTKDALGEEGAIVSDFSSGKTALDIIRKVKPFDIILVDLVMPEMNGVEVTRAIREWERDKDIRVPIVAVTGDQSDVLAKQCIEAGANGCMGKPLVIPELSRLLILSMKAQSRKAETRLEETIRIANTDPLTSVKNNNAFHEKVLQLNQKLRENPDCQFGIVIADINRLKYENDTFGHNVGDIYIKNCCRLICGVYAHSPVYRIGGDEFAVVLEEDDLKKQKELFEMFNKRIEFAQQIKTSEQGKASIAAGTAVYQKGLDFSVDDVMKRADEEMYINKKEFKKQLN